LTSEAPSVPLEERKVVSVLFCDLVGFTGASDAADPEDVRARLRPYHERVRVELRSGALNNRFTLPTGPCLTRTRARAGGNHADTPGSGVPDSLAA